MFITLPAETQTKALESCLPPTVSESVSEPMITPAALMHTTVHGEEEDLIGVPTGTSPHLRRLDISMNSPEDFDDLQNAKSWTNLTHIRIQSRISVPLLYSILQRASVVEELSVTIIDIEPEWDPESSPITPVEIIPAISTSLVYMTNIDFNGPVTTLYSLLCNTEVPNLLHLTIRVGPLDKCEVPPPGVDRYLKGLKSLVIFGCSITGLTVEDVTNILLPCQNLNHLVLYSRLADFNGLFQALSSSGQVNTHPNLRKVDLWITNQWSIYLHGGDEAEEQPYFTPSSFIDFSKHHEGTKVAITDCRVPCGDPTEVFERRRRRRCEIRAQLVEEGLDESSWPTMKNKAGYSRIQGCQVSFGDNTANQDLRGDWEQWWKLEQDGASPLYC